MNFHDLDTTDAGAAGWPALPRRAAPAALLAALLAAFMLACAALLLVPAGLTVWLSLSDGGPGAGAAGGLARYRALLQAPVLVPAIRGLACTLLAALPLTALSLGLALLADRWLRGRGGRRRPLRWLLPLLFFLPFLLPVTPATLLAHALLQVSGTALGPTLVAGQRAWLAEPGWAVPAAALGAAWWTAGLNLLLLLAGLRRVPAALYEAAALDGARGWVLFRAVTWPALRPYAGAALLLQCLAGPQVLARAGVLDPGQAAAYSVCLAGALALLGLLAALGAGLARWRSRGYM